MLLEGILNYALYLCTAFFDDKLAGLAGFFWFPTIFFLVIDVCLSNLHNKPAIKISVKDY